MIEDIDHNHHPYTLHYILRDLVPPQAPWRHDRVVELEGGDQVFRMVDLSEDGSDVVAGALSFPFGKRQRSPALFTFKRGDQIVVVSVTKNDDDDWELGTSVGNLRVPLPYGWTAVNNGTLLAPIIRDHLIDVFGLPGGPKGLDKAGEIQLAMNRGELECHNCLWGTVCHWSYGHSKCKTHSNDCYTYGLAWLRARREMAIAEGVRERVMGLRPESMTVGEFDRLLRDVLEFGITTEPIDPKVFTEWHVRKNLYQENRYKHGTLGTPWRRDLHGSNPLNDPTYP